MLYQSDLSNIQNFLNYDFVGDKKKGKYLAVVDTDGKPSLQVINFSDLGYCKKKYYRHTCCSFYKVADFVKTYFMDQAMGSVKDNRELWEIQFAYFSRKVTKYNQSLIKWGTIEFKNPLLEYFELTVIYPKIPEKLGVKIQHAARKIIIAYSPLTTFKTVEKTLKKFIGPEGLYYVDKRSDRVQLAGLSKSGRSIKNWVKDGNNASMKVNYLNINLPKYNAYHNEIAYSKGLYDGKIAQSFTIADRQKPAKQLAYQAMKEKQAKTKDEINEKYDVHY